MYIKILVIISMSLLFFGCSPKKLFPTDNTEYDSIKNYNYEYTEHKFNSKDGTSLYGMHIKTKQQSKGLIVVANGMHHNMSFRFTEWLWIVNSGYNLFIFDYRGYGKSKDIADMFGFREDVNAGLEYAHMLEEDKDIVLIGQSMGGSFAIDALAEKNYSYVSLVVSDSTFTGFDSILSSYMMKSIILFPFSWLPYTFTPKELNSIENIKDVKVPVLFISGDDDWIVSCEYSKELYKKANKDKSIWLVEDTGHVQSFNNKSVRQAFLKLLENSKLLTKNKERFF